MGMGHPHPAMSMMSGAPPVAGMSISGHAPRIPGAVLTNGLASKSLLGRQSRETGSAKDIIYLCLEMTTDPYIQHNSLASAGPVYPYNASMYSEQPYHQEQQQRLGGYESGMYAFAGGMPDSLPRNSFSQNAHLAGMPRAPSGYMVAPNPAGYPSTIYPDSPELQPSGQHLRETHGCDGCRAAKRREDSRRYEEERGCGCHHQLHSHHQSRRHTRRYRSPGAAVPFSDSSSEDDQEDDTYLRPSRRRRRAPVIETQQLLPTRSRHGSSGSRQRRTASRAPGLPSVIQRSVGNDDYSDSDLPEFVSKDVREKNDGAPAYRHERRRDDPYPQVNTHRDDFDRYRPRPEDLRLDALRIHENDPRRGDSIPPARERHMSIQRSLVHPGGVMTPVSPILQRLSPRPLYRDPQVRSHSRNSSRGPGHSRGIAPPDQRHYHPPQSLPRHLGSPPQEDLEVFPLVSKRYSPSRLHRHEYGGNQPAGLTTPSKLHPNFPEQSLS